MANEELKEQIDLKKELLKITQKIIDADDDARDVLLDQAKLLTQAVQGEKDNNKLKKIALDLAEKANFYGKINHGVQRDSYETLSSIVGKKMEENRIDKQNVESAKEKLTRTKAMIKGLNSASVSLLGMFGLTTGIVGLFTKFNALTRQIGEEFGAIGMQNERFKRAALETNVEAAKIGKNMKDVLSVTKSLTKEFGFSRDEALNVSNQIIDTSLALGMSSEEGAKLIGSLVQISGLSFESANNFAKQTSLLAQAEGAAPNAVIRDIAESSETIAKFTGMTPDNLAKAAIQANKLGLQLKDIASSAEGLLSFQDSLNKEIEASILLGRDVNLQKARELALNNDLEGVAIEITKQVGGQAEFEKMNLLQRKALAASIGMSVEQLAKVVSNQDKIRSLNDRIGEQKGFVEKDWIIYQK